MCGFVFSLRLIVFSRNCSQRPVAWVYQNRCNHHHNSFQLHHQQQSSAYNPTLSTLSRQCAECVRLWIEFLLFRDCACMYPLLCADKDMHSCAAVEKSSAEGGGQQRRASSALPGGKGLISYLPYTCFWPKSKLTSWIFSIT